LWISTIQKIKYTNEMMDTLKIETEISRIIIIRFQFIKIDFLIEMVF